MIMSQTDKSILGATSMPNRRGRDLVILIGLFVLMLVGLIGVAAATGWEETKAQLAKLSLGQVGILLLFSLRVLAYQIPFPSCLIGNCNVVLSNIVGIELH